MTAAPINSGAERAAFGTLAIGVVLATITGLSWLFDERLITGISVWSKPIKFSLSFSLHLLTLVWLVSLLEPRARSGRWAGGALLAASAATLVEILYVAVQGARGRASHFNTETAFESFMYYQVMGGAALVLVATTFAIGVLVLRAGRSELSAGLRLGAWLGATLGAVATLGTAGLLATGAVDGPGPWVGGERSNASGLPLVGWSTTGGDLRVAHFFATHMIQFLPLMGFLADRLQAKRPRLLVLAAAAVALGVTGGALVQALNGRPLLPASAGM
jgi:hypothetical protein